MMDSNTASTGSRPTTDKSSSPLPHLRKTKTSAQLYVHGRPFLILGAELQNSSLSNAAYMSSVWPQLVKMSVNTVLGSVTWEMIEPSEGHFDFSELDTVIAGARQHKLHLVLLWFGSYKNAMSSYVPGWVKKDAKRFPRVHAREAGGRVRTVELLSPWSKEAVEADARAFAKLMKHVKEVDSEQNTVIMVQVENEMGLLGDARDGSKTASERFAQPVPEELLKHLKGEFDNLHPRFKAKFGALKQASAGASWAEAFGPDLYAAEEMFMADAFSRYVSKVARAGRAEYDIPLYANTWMNVYDDTPLELDGGVPIVAGGGDSPGQYPSGGPVAHAHDIYRFNAPELDFLAPDLYLQAYEPVCRDFRSHGQPLFIPEQRRDDRGARRVWLAYATYGAMGCSPFGIDTQTPEESPFTKHFGLLKSVSEYVLDAQANRPDDMVGFFFDELSEANSKSQQTEWIKSWSDYELTIERAYVFGKPGPGAGMVIRQSNGSFLLVGWGFQAKFRATSPQATFTGILHSEEKVVNREGKLETGRIFGGDETRSGAVMVMPNDVPDYGGFPIAISIPARTGIAEVTAYWIEEEEGDM